MTSLNGLLRDWEYFNRGIYAGINLTKFNKFWEDYVQEEGRIANREEKLNDGEYEALEAHANKG